MIDYGFCHCHKTHLFFAPIVGYIGGCHHCGEFYRVAGVCAYHSEAITGIDDGRDAQYGLSQFVFRGVPSTE